MILQGAASKLFGLFTGIILLLLFICFSVVYGYTNTSWSIAIQSFTAFNGSNEHLIIQSTRVPRAMIAATVGASLGIAGTLMQAITRNPLASPTIFGINAGASFFIVCSVSIFSISSLQAFTWIAFWGAAMAAGIVYLLGSFGREGLTPMKLTLAGAAITAMFSSFTQGLLVLNERALEEVLFWLAGSVQGRSLDMLGAVLPYLILGWVGSLFLAKQINILLMGDDVAKGLGLKTGLIKLAAALFIILLSGGSVAVAGPIVFLGIIVPHISRFLVGNDHRWVIPYSAILGGIILLIADIGARYIIMPQEVPVGIMTAFIGTPFFLYIARKGMGS